MENLKIILKNKDVEQIKKLISDGYKFSTEHLNLALKFNDKEIANEILNQKVIPDTNSFLNFLATIHIDKKKYNKDGFIMGENIEKYEIFNLLINFGYKLTQTDLLLMTHKFLYVSNVAKYNLILDTYIMHFCQNTFFFPYDKIEPSKDIFLDYLSENFNSNLCKTMIKKYDFKPSVDFIAILINTEKSTAMKLIEDIHNNFIELTPKVFIAVCKKINNINNIILNKNYNIYRYMLFKKEKNAIDNCTYNSIDLLNYVTKNNFCIKKLHYTICDMKDRDTKAIENIISSFNIQYDIQLIKYLFVAINRYFKDIANGKGWLCDIIKIHQVELDIESLKILHETLIDYILLL